MILITGARGHIGNTLLYELSREYGKDNLKIFVKSSKGIDYIKDLAGEVVIGDIRNFDEVLHAVKDCEYVYHTAAVISLGKKVTKELYGCNVLGTRNIVNACLKSGVKRLIYTSSVETLKTPKKGKIQENLADIKDADGAYAYTKILANREIDKGREQGLDIISVYPSAVIGTRDYKGSYSKKIISYYKSRFFIKFYFKGAYNFVDVRDIALALKNAMTANNNCNDYILANQKQDLKQVAKLIGNAVNKKSVYVRIPYFLLITMAFLYNGVLKLFGKTSVFNPYSISILQRNCDFDIQKAKRDLNFCPRELNQTFFDTVNWLENNK